MLYNIEGRNGEGRGGEGIGLHTDTGDGGRADEKGKGEKKIEGSKKEGF